MAKSVVENKFGCGLMGGIFHRRSLYTQKTPIKSLPTSVHTNNVNKSSSTNDSKKHQQKSLDDTYLQSTSKPPPKPTPPSNHQKHGTRPLEASRKSSSEPSRKSSSEPSRKPSSEPSRSSTSSSNNSTLTKVSKVQDLADLTRTRREVGRISTDLSTIIHNHEQSNGSKDLVRANSGNVMLLGHLGNLKQNQNSNPSTPNKKSYTPNIRSGSTGNILGRSNKTDPEVLKNMGNEEYKRGRFEDALGLYNQAISNDSNNATYHSNKAAALAGLGRIMEAVFECREAIKLDPYYHKAHHRLAALYLRLGEAEKASCHFKYLSAEANSDCILQAKALQAHLNKCSEARKLGDWNTLLKETERAISSGVDSSPQMYALQADALLKLHRHEEANASFQKRPNFDIKSSIEIFGAGSCSYLLIVQAQLYLAMGRLEEGLASAQNASQLDSNNKQVSTELRRIEAVASARMRGNQLYNASRLSEACCAYNEGLEHDPYNSLLLCNRAACRSKLGQFEKAIEDCSVALKVRPSYSKARLRRASCNAKSARWEASIQDYEMLLRETPGDEEVGRALFEAQIQLKKQNGEDTTDMKFGSDLVYVDSNERFKHFTTSPGMTVVLFCNKSCKKQVLQLLGHVCKRFPTVNFLKVEVEDHPYLAKTEEVSSIPVFKIYKNGSMIKEIPGTSIEVLEKAIHAYSR